MNSKFKTDYLKKMIYILRTNVVRFRYVTFSIHCQNMRLFVNYCHTVDSNIKKIGFKIKEIKINNI